MLYTEYQVNPGLSEKEKSGRLLEKLNSVIGYHPESISKYVLAHTLRTYFALENGIAAQDLDCWRGCLRM